MRDDAEPLEGFPGITRLFPLPNVVLFPCVIQRLHIFEPRYRQMTADALAGDRLLTLILLRPGWESDYEGRPPLYPVGCLGHINDEERLPDGRYHFQLHGLKRVRITKELKSGKLYRSARVEMLDEVAPATAAAEQTIRRQLLQVAPPWCPQQGSEVETVCTLIKSPVPVGAVSDILSFVLPLSVEFKQELLENPDVEQRARALIQYLQTNPAPGPPPAGERQFPPEFSTN